MPCAVRHARSAGEMIHERGQDMGRSKSGHRKRVLLATTLAITVAGSVSVAAQAQERAAPQQSSATRLFRFDIAAQPLPQALNEIGRTTGLAVIFTGSQPFNVTGRPVQGNLTPSQALATLLAGTGITYRFTNPRTVTIDTGERGGSVRGGATPAGAIALDTIDVQGAGNPNSTMTPMPAYAGGQIATGAQVGMLGNRSVMNTPFSQTSYTNQTIKDQQAQTVQDVLVNDPSVLTNKQSGGRLNEETSIRGFRTGYGDASGTLNGMMGMSPLSSPDMDYVERVEVLRGPGALLNGMAANSGGIGGTVNLRTKQAGDEPLTQLTTRFTSRGQAGAHVDFARRFGDQKEFGLRFNGAFHKGAGPVNPTSEEIGSAALNLDYRGERIRLSTDIVRQSYNANPGNHQLLDFWGIDVVPRAPDAGTGLNPSWSKQQVNQTVAMTRGEVDVTDNLTVYGAIGKQRSDQMFRGTLVPTLLDTSGTYGWSALSNMHLRYDVLSMQGGFRATATTGPVDHKLNLNLSQSRFRSQAARPFSPYASTTNLYDPVFGPEPVFPDVGNLMLQMHQKRSSVAFADTMSILDERIQFTAGLRYQEVTSSTAWSDPYGSTAVTPAYALVVKPRENVSVYANYIQALEPGQVVGMTYANAGEMLPPYLSEQYETGAKVDWGTVTTTLAVFQITQASVVAVPGTPLPTLTINGQQRNRGIELNAYGEVVPGIRLMSGVTLLDARLTKTEGGLNDGDRAHGVPKFRTVIGAEWDTPFVQGLTLNGRVNYTSDQVVSGRDGTIPSWTTLDLGARYTFNSPWNETPVTVRFNVDNVFDRDYWSTGTYNFIFLGTPRIYRLSATFRF